MTDLFNELQVIDREEDAARIDKVAVVGHRNPDTDSICSAIAYAALKNEIDPKKTYTAYRSGRINDETAFVLDYFDTPRPHLLKDIKARVEDVDYRKSSGVHEDISIHEAWKLLKERNIYTLPVTEPVSDDEDLGERLTGLVTMQDIGRIYLDEMSSTLLSTAKTPVKNILKVLQGKLIVGCEEKELSKGKVLIAAVEQGELFTEFVEKDDIVIVADREEMHRVAIREGAGCLIITVGSEVSEEIREYAMEHGCIIISTEYNTFATARLIMQSIPLRFLMTKAEIVISFTPNSYLSDVRKVMAKKRYRDFPVIAENGCYLGTISRRFLLDSPRKSIIMVDHNEKEQSASGIEEARILEIIDHHRLAPVETADPVTFRSLPCGSTSTIIYEIFKEKGIVPEKRTAGLLCAAIISDTLLFRSPTTTGADKIAGVELAGIAGLDMEGFATEMFSVGTVSADIGKSDPTDILLRDFKSFHISDKDIGIGQIIFSDKESLEDAIETLISAISEARATKRVDVMYVLLTDVQAGDSCVIYDGDGASDILETAFRKTSENGRFYLSGVMSRKKQFVPEIFQALQ